MLKINRIKIENFRQFKKIEAKFEEEKGIFLFIGKNGIGKSNFLNAVCWCLYEKQPFRFHDKAKSLLNEETALKNPNAYISVEIEVSMDGDIYSFRRSKAEIQDSSFSVMKRIGQDWKEVDNPNIVVNNFLPESIMNFFVFDGEAIQNLFKGDYAKNIKDSVWKVSDVEIIDNALEHLENTNNDIRRKLSRDIPKDKQKEEDLTVINEQLKKIKLELREKEKLFSELRNKVEKLRKKEKQYGKYRELHQKREEIEKQLETAEIRSVEYQKEINNLIVEIGPFYYAKQSLQDVKDMVGKDIKKGEIPPDIRGKFILDLIERGKCICGRDIIKGEFEYLELNKLLDSVSPKEEREILIADSYFINKTLNELNDLPTELENLKRKKSRERNEIEKFQIQLRDIKEQLRNAPDKEVGDLEKTIQFTNDQIYEIKSDIGRLSSEENNYGKRAVQIQKELNEAISKKGQNDILSKKYELINNSFEKLSAVREKIINQVRAAASLKTEQYFKEMIWKKGEFEKIKFDDTYELSVYKSGRDDISSLRDLSTGELKVLGFATLKALAEISGFRVVPVFIDGPLEYLDEEVQSSFLEQLPKFMPDKQVFIFSVDRESILKFGKNKIKKDNFYKLSRTNNSLSTELISYNK